MHFILTTLSLAFAVGFLMHCTFTVFSVWFYHCLTLFFHCCTFTFFFPPPLACLAVPRMTSPSHKLTSFHPFKNSPAIDYQMPRWWWKSIFSAPYLQKIYFQCPVFTENHSLSVNWPPQVRHVGDLGNVHTDRFGHTKIRVNDRQVAMNIVNIITITIITISIFTNTN